MVGGMKLKQTANNQYNIDIMTLKSRLDTFSESGTVNKKKRGPEKKERFTDKTYKHICRFVDVDIIASYGEIYDNFQMHFNTTKIGQHTLKTYVQNIFHITQYAKLEFCSILYE
ncbi:hypothetical protein BDC45DRAFT_534587 [Circinella umbellata]|nr:hypothetical protein BDC45DRAFT_534587 [Circinella umbellata]